MIELSIRSVLTITFLAIHSTFSATHLKELHASSAQLQTVFEMEKEMLDILISSRPEVVKRSHGEFYLNMACFLLLTLKVGDSLRAYIPFVV